MRAGQRSNTDGLQSYLFLRRYVFTGLGQPARGVGRPSFEVAPPHSRAQGPKRFSPKQKRGFRVVMPIDPNRPWGRSSASAAALLPLRLATAPPPSSVLCFSCPARLRRRQEGGCQASFLAPPQPSRRRPPPPPPGPSARRRRRRSWRNRRSPPWRSPLLGLGSQELPP